MIGELKNCVYGATYATADDTQLNNVDHSALFDNSNIKVTDFAIQQAVYFIVQIG